MVSESQEKQVGEQAEALVAELFRAEGWKVQRNVAYGRYKADLLIQRPGKVFVVEIKAFSEGRSDRVLPLLSHNNPSAKNPSAKNPSVNNNNPPMISLVFILITQSRTSIYNFCSSTGAYFSHVIAAEIDVHQTGHFNVFGRVLVKLHTLHQR